MYGFQLIVRGGSYRGQLMNIEKAADALHTAILRMVETLMEIDPPADSPEGRMLEGLSDAVEEYEKERYPF